MAGDSPLERLVELLAHDLDRESDAEIVDHLVAHARALGAALSFARDTPEGVAPLRALREAIVRFVLAKNQFARIDDAGLAALDGAIQRVLAGLARSLAAPDHVRPQKIAETLATYRGDVGAFVRERAAGADVVSASYSPPVQLTVLALDEDAIADPVLDVGCGPDASLVRFLRDLGHDAHGLDRDAPNDVGTASDWLAFDYGEARWGTIVSHLAFSLHFLHHHLAPEGAAADYARTFLRIVRALKPGGLFAYAPSLPFFEPHLPTAKVRIERVVFPSALVTPALREAEAKTGLVLGSATHVRRIG